MAITLIGRIGEQDLTKTLPDTGEVYIGRDYKNKKILEGFLIPDVVVSRIHCVINKHGEDAYGVKDLKSTNGTFVNGKSAGEEILLSNGDELSVTGKYVFKVTIE